MKSTIILALTGSTLAVPFIEAMFGANMEARHEPHPDYKSGFHPIGTGSGIGFPFPTGTGPCPTASGGRHQHSRYGHPRKSKTLAIDYTLAPTVVPTPGGVVKRQGGTQTLPTFTLLDPSGAVPGAPTPTGTPGSSAPTPTPQPEDPESPSPTATDSLPFPEPTSEPEDPEDPEDPFPTGAPEPPFPIPSGRPSGPFPTGGFPAPTGGFPFPTGGFPSPTGGFPTRPTTLMTHTRGQHPTHTRGPRPTPTAQPEFPQYPGDHNDEEKEPSNGDGPGWMSWLQDLFGNGRSQMEN